MGSSKHGNPNLFGVFFHPESMDQRTYSAISCPARLLVGEFLWGFWKKIKDISLQTSPICRYFEKPPFIEGWKILGGMRSIHQNYELLLKRNRIAWLIAPVVIQFFPRDSHDPFENRWDSGWCSMSFHNFWEGKPVFDWFDSHQVRMDHDYDGTSISKLIKSYEVATIH